jgi:hypothetical protein
VPPTLEAFLPAARQEEETGLLRPHALRICIAITPNLLISLLQKEYMLNSKEQPRVFIVGAGPGTTFWNDIPGHSGSSVLPRTTGGLRTAIEALLLGSRVTLVEMRKRFTRHNLLHVRLRSHILATHLI